ncbi:MAG TPA: DNA polymerase Y family protein [Dehalococcoidia bacterium]
MRVAFVSIPRFPCAVETQRNPALARRPFIVGDADQPKRVLDCSAAAAAQGVSPGLTIRQALARCPDAAILAPDAVSYRRAWESVLDALGCISPEIEDADLGGAYVDVHGLAPFSGGLGVSPSLHYSNDATLCDHLFQTIKQSNGLEAAIGLANGKFPAFAAATCASPGESQAVPVGGEGGFLAPLPVDLLPIDPEIVFRLRLFGIEAIGGVAALSLPELQSQFGARGRRLWRLANGADDEPLYPRPLVEKLEAGLSFEAPVAGIEVLVAAAKQLLSRLNPTLRGRAARELILQAELISGRGWERRIVLREAVSENQRLDFVLRASLQNAPPPNAVRNISLRLAGLTGESGKQLSLGERGRLQRQLEECIRQLKARYGYSPVFRCVDVEPWSVVPEERQILVESDV